MLPASGRLYTQVGQRFFSLVYRVAISANFPCKSKAFVLPGILYLQISMIILILK